MKKRNTCIGVLLSLIVFGQPIYIKTGILSAIAGLVLSVPEKVNAENADFYFQRARIKTDSGDVYGAIADYSKAIEINPYYVEAYYNRGNRKRDLGDNYGAMSDYSKAIELDSFFSLAYVNRSIQKEKLGDLTGACEDAKKAVSAELKNLNVYKQIQKGGNPNWLRENQAWIKKNC